MGEPMTLHATNDELIEMKALFVQAMRECGNYEVSALVSGRSARQFRRYEEADPDFAADIGEAHAEYWALFRHNVAQRLQWGVVTPVYQTGRLVGYIRKYQDSTAVGMLAKYDPLISDKPQRVIIDGPEAEADEVDFSRFETLEEAEAYKRLSRKARGEPEEDEPSEDT